jgi:hypothetical protein
VELMHLRGTMSSPPVGGGPSGTRAGRPGISRAAGTGVRNA